MLSFQRLIPMIDFVKTRAYANIALVKYWGKQTEGINRPATPSLSLTIDVLKTETTLRRDNRDSLIFNDTPVTDISHTRAFEIINDWRRQGLLDGCFSIVTKNGFPSGAGLASSASGVAALTVGLARMAKTALDDDTLNHLTRQGSGSAARSLTGGVSILTNDNDPISRQIIPPEEIPWCINTAVTDVYPKKIGSREAMEVCRRTSPYYATWLHLAQIDFNEMLDAVEIMDFARIGKIAERNCLAMHACMWASRPSLMYLNGVTLNIISAVKSWRSEGLESYFTIDAGPQVCVLGKRQNAEIIGEKLRAVPGVLKVLNGLPAGGAEVITCE